MDSAEDLVVNKILKERYFLVQDNSWEDVCRRVSQILEDPAKQQKFYEIMVSKKFIPSSPTIMNFDPLGKTCGGLSSCFPLSIGDSIDEIGQALHDCMTVVKYSGGVGYNFSKLRSSKEAVKSLNNSNSSGPLSYERIFSKVLDEIQQGGRRRGAGMAAYDIDHPDILDVIESKRNVKDTRYQRFNHSIRVSEEFYYFLEHNPDAIWNVKFKDGTVHPLTDNNNKPVTVQELWDKIIDCAWASAEPGIINISIATEKNVVSKNPLDIGFNPCCLTGDMKILTDKGYITIEEIFKSKDKPKIISLDIENNKFIEEEIEKCWIAGDNAEIIELELENGEIVKLTPEHRVLTDKGYKQAKDLNSEDEIIEYK